MKRQWQIRRYFQESADAARRWDQAYQLLLQWSQVRQPDATPPSHPSAHPQTETNYDHGHLCPCIDRSSDASPNH